MQRIMGSNPCWNLAMRASSNEPYSKRLSFALPSRSIRQWVGRTCARKTSRALARAQAAVCAYINCQVLTACAPVRQLAMDRTENHKRARIRPKV